MNSVAVMLGHDARAALGSRQDPDGSKSQRDNAAGVAVRLESRRRRRLLPGPHSLGA